MKNLRINNKRINALVGAIILSTNLTACRVAEPEEKTDGKETYTFEDSVLNSDGIQYLVIADGENQKIVPVEDLKLVNSKNEVIEKIDGVIVNEKIMGVENPVNIMFSDNIDEVIIGYDILPVSEFSLINGKTGEKLTNIIGAYVNNEFVVVNNKQLDENILTDERFFALADEIYKKYSNLGLDVTRENVIDFVMMVNIDKLSRDNKELVETIIGERNPDEVVLSSFKVYSAIMTENNDRYCAKGLGWDSLILVSDTVFDAEERETVINIEKRFEEIFNARGNKEEFNKLLNKMLMDMCDAEKDEFNMDSGVGYSTMTILVNFIRINFFGDLDKTNDELIKYFVTFEGDGLEYEQNSMMNAYYSGMYNLITECENTKTLTR